MVDRSTVTENGLIDEKDFEDFRKRSVESKFKTALYGGFGNAAVFGLFAGLSAAIIPALTALSASIGPAGAIGLGVAAIGSLAGAGIYLIHLANQEMFRSTVLDQDFQAKKIASYTVSAPGHELVHQQEPARTDGKRWQEVIQQERERLPAQRVV